MGALQGKSLFLLPAVPQIYLRKAWGAGVIIFPVPRVTPVWSQPTTVMSLFGTDVFEVGVELSSGACDVRKDLPGAHREAFCTGEARRGFLSDSGHCPGWE